MKVVKDGKNISFEGTENDCEFVREWVQAYVKMGITRAKLADLLSQVLSNLDVVVVLEHLDTHPRQKFGEIERPERVYKRQERVYNG